MRQWHKFKLNLPLIGKLNEKIIAVRFTRTLSTMLSSGMSMMQALEIVTKVVNNNGTANSYKRRYPNWNEFIGILKKCICNASYGILDDWYW